MATTSQSFPRLPADADLGAPVHVRERVVPLGEIVPVGRANSTLDLVGNTPLLELKRLTAGLIPAGVRIFAKLEGFNPGGSVKDRPAKKMIEVGIAEGKLKPGKVILDSTSGNTGIALAMIGATHRLSGRAGDAVEREPRAQENRRGLRREDSLLRSDGGFRRRDPAVPQAVWRRTLRATSSPTSTTTRPTRWRISKPPARKSGARPVAR